MHPDAVDQGTFAFNQHLLIFDMGTGHMPQAVNSRAGLVQPAIDRIFKAGRTGNADFNSCGALPERFTERLRHGSYAKNSALVGLCAHAANRCSCRRVRRSFHRVSSLAGRGIFFSLISRLVSILSFFTCRSASSNSPAAIQRANSSGVSKVTRPSVPARNS